MNRCPREQGVALALVLWLVILLGTTAATLASSTRSGSGVVLNARARTVARYAAQSGITAAVALLERRMAGVYTPEQRALAFASAIRELGDLRDVPLGQARFGVELTNLSGRLDLNQAEPATLEGLFSQFTSAAIAHALVDALQDWRDVDSLVRPQGAEHEAYLRAGSPYIPTNAPLNHMDELRRIRGATDDLVRVLTPYLTVNGDLLIDVNAAPETVLAALPGVGPRGASTLVSQRRRRGLFASISEVHTLLGSDAARSGVTSIARLTIAPSRVLLVSRGWQPGNPLTHEIEAAYAIVGQELRLQSWRERDL
jgi:general secretion pathway protein K